MKTSVWLFFLIPNKGYAGSSTVAYFLFFLHEFTMFLGRFFLITSRELYTVMIIITTL